MTETGACDVAALCARAGVVDALVFRRVSSSTWAHLGGLGRGKGWAGLVDVDSGAEPVLALRPGEVQVYRQSAPTRVIGPYYAVGAAAVRISNDVLVVLGNPDAQLAPDGDPHTLRELATCLEAELEDITPSKRLGDELEVLHAVRAVITTPVLSIAETLQHVIGVAAEALSCEAGAVRDGGGRTAVVRGWDVDPNVLATGLDALVRQAAGRTLCVQDTDAEPMPAPFRAVDGVRSVLAVPLPAPIGGVLVTAHTEAGPRGFTSLCQRLGEQVADTAGVIAHTAVLREDLRGIADEQFRHARTDALTGLGNRLCWEEALAEAQERVDAGSPIAVITVDVDGLKELNDTYGHDQGDALLRRCADILREHSRGDDTISRVGGDEFALLLPVGPALAAERVTALTKRFDVSRSCREHVAASVGLGTATPGQRVIDAVRDADSAMYAQKKARRAQALSRHA